MFLSDLDQGHGICDILNLDLFGPDDVLSFHLERLRLGIEKVVDLFVVNLDVLYMDFNGRTVRKDLVHWEVDQALVVAKHCVSFAWASLAVGKDGTVDLTVKYLQYDMLHLIGINLFGFSFSIKDLIKSKNPNFLTHSILFFCNFLLFLFHEISHANKRLFSFAFLLLIS
jgi:hypothetical protein